MKNIHFCTPELLKILKDHKEYHITTYRTGWIPQIFVGDRVALNERVEGKPDKFIRMAIVESVTPIQYKKLNWEAGLTVIEEIARYNKNFHRDQYFFEIVLRKD